MSVRRLAGLAAALALLGVLGALLGPAAPALATEDVVCQGGARVDAGAPRPPEVAPPGPEPLDPGAQESVRSYKVILTIEAHGTLAVVERFTYDFGPATDRHGVVHELDLTRSCSDGSERTYDMRNLVVTSPSGAPADVVVEEESGVTRLRVGDPTRPVSGVEEYVISYRLDGVVDALADHGELSWTAPGAAWGVPVHHMVVRALPFEPVTAATCVAGPPGTTEPCAAMAVSDDLVLYEQPYLTAGAALTVAMTLPPGHAEAPAPPGGLTTDAFDTQGGGWPVLVVAAGAAAVAAVVAAGVWALGARRRR